MEIGSFRVRDFRCIAEVRVELSADEVWLIGPNASGKTSLLEAIYLLLRGHTFLSTRHGPLVRMGAESASIECRIHTNEDQSERLTCLVRGRARHARLGGEEVSYQSLARRIGLVRFFGANAQELISGEPRIRRTFVDWNLLHVVPAYRDLSAKYSRLLQQRNAALKARMQPVTIWDADLAMLAEQIAEHREKYLKQIADEIKPIGTRFFGGRAPALKWLHGWPLELGMLDALRRNADSDQRRGFTQCGPHRFSAVLSIGSNQAVGSRGEQKLLAATFQIACETVHIKYGNQPSIWLVDDAFAELTPGNGALLINELRGFSGQTFFASMSEPAESLVNGPRTRQVFHVEHGVFHEH